MLQPVNASPAMAGGPLQVTMSARAGSSPPISSTTTSTSSLSTTERGSPVRIAPVASPETNSMPIKYMPASEMITVHPAKKTALPAVAIDFRGPRPRTTSSRPPKIRKATELPSGDHTTPGRWRLDESIARSPEPSAPIKAPLEL